MRDEGGVRRVRGMRGSKKGEGGLRGMRGIERGEGN